MHNVPVSLATLVLLAGTSVSVQAQSNIDDLLKLSLKDLATVVVRGATLAGTASRQTPAAVTTITARDIRLSGARDLDELFDIFVPGFQYLNKAQGPMMGIRGILNDRNNKILLLVNGRNMNVKGADGGAIIERLMSMMGDIRKIEVIRAAGSAMHGPGAIAGVISIETLNGRDFDGAEISLKGGAVEQFVNGEVKYGRTFANGMALFAYFGADDYRGADKKDAPLYFSQSFTTEGGREIVAGEPSEHPGTLDDRTSMHDRIRKKAHVQLVGERLNLVAHYTRGGVHGQSTPRIFARDADDFLLNHGTGYEQALLSAEFGQQIRNWLKLNYHASFDLTDVQIGKQIHHWREDEFLTGIRAFMKLGERNQFTVGGEVSRETFGKKSGFVRHLPSDINNDIPFGTRWDTTMYSILAEDIWEASDRWTIVTGFRADKHTFTPLMWSPRLAVVSTPNDKDTFKFMANRSVRRPEDADLYRANLGDRKVLGGVERIHQYELRYERLHSPSYWFAGSAYFNDHHVVTWDPVAGLTDVIGDVDTYGIEMEAAIRTGKFGLRFSHNFTRLADFDNTRGVEIQGISTSPYGFGNDLVHWSNHSTKLAMDYAVSPDWTFVGSVRANWGYPGAIDLADYNAEVYDSHQGFALYDDSKRAFQHSMHLNVGAEYRPTEDISVRIHAYNLLGLFDDALNKRNAYLAMGMYRSEAPAIAASFDVKL